MNIEIIKAMSEDAYYFLEYTKQIGSEIDNLTVDKNGISISIEDDEKQIEEWYHSSNNLMLLAKKREDYWQ